MVEGKIGRDDAARHAGGKEAAASGRPLGVPSGRKPILVVCGLAAEARIAAGGGVVTVATPPTVLAARLDAIGKGVSAVISFGLCGGLDAGLAPGSLVVPDRVIADGAEWRCDAALVERLRARLDGYVALGPAGAMAGRDAPIMTVAEKAALRQSTGCVAVDTESHIAASFAAARGLPFAAIRAVCDAAHRDLPPLAIRAIGPNGQLDWPAIGREIVTRPGQMLALPGTALATAQAMGCLRRVRRRLGPRFGF